MKHRNFTNLFQCHIANNIDNLKVRIIRLQLSHSKALEKQTIGSVLEHFVEASNFSGFLAFYKTWVQRGFREEVQFHLGLLAYRNTG